MQAFDIYIAPGKSQVISMVSSYIYYRAGSAGGVDATIVFQPLSGGETVFLAPGQAYKLKDGGVGTAWILTNLKGEGTIIGEILMGEGEFTDNNVSGSVQVIDGGKALTMAGRAFLTAGGCGQVAAKFSNWGIWNPEGSGVKVILSGYSATCVASTAISMRVSKGKLTAFEKFGVTKNRMPDLEIISNGDFANGLNDWAAYSGAEFATINLGWLRLDSAAAAGLCARMQDFKVITGHRYRVRAKLKTVSAVGTFALNIYSQHAIAGIIKGYAPSDVVGEILQIDDVVTATTDFMRVYLHASANRIQEVDDISIVDLDAGASKAELRNENTDNVAPRSAGELDVDYMRIAANTISSRVLKEQVVLWPGSGVHLTILEQAATTLNGTFEWIEEPV